MPTSALLQAVQATSSQRTRLEQFILADSERALLTWLVLDGGGAPESRAELLARLTLGIAQIDRLLGEQLDAVLHAEHFQRLEASWRGLRGLVENVGPEDNVQVRVLDLSWKELARDLERADFDQSRLFDKIYSEEIGRPGGDPFGVLLGDYFVTQSAADIAALRAISGVAAAAFAPFVAGASPSILELQSFAELERPLDLAKIFQQERYVGWNALRKEEDARFVGLTLPRVLLRLPWGDDSSRADGFRYAEDTSQRQASGYLWGNAVYAFGEVLIRAFTEHGWLAAIRGVRRDETGGGLVTGLARDWHRSDPRNAAPKGSLEVQLTYEREQQLAELGFIPITHCQPSGEAAFYSNCSLQDWRAFASSRRTRDGLPEVNAKISSMLQYMFCVSRFAHYVKLMVREKIGSFATAQDVQQALRDWLIKYATATKAASAVDQARYPLRDARVLVKDVPGRPGTFSCEVSLRPHYQLDELGWVDFASTVYASPEM